MKNEIELLNPFEEQLNVISHGFGVLLGVLLLSYFLYVSTFGLGLYAALALIVYAVSFILLFLASAVYHHAESLENRLSYKRFDHAAIYLLIAGTYTPYLVIGLGNAPAYAMLAIIWLIAFAGVVFKIYFAGRFGKLSLAAYLMMGWLCIFQIKTLFSTLPRTAFWLLLAGGVAYSVGAMFYATKRMAYSHFVWHVFVLLGAGLHAAGVICIL